MSESRNPRNVPGDFYVRANECIHCGAPEDEAPDLMRTRADGCFFVKQPETPEETERAVRAVRASCCEAVQYSGRDPAILERLGGLGDSSESQRRGRPWWKLW